MGAAPSRETHRRGLFIVPQCAHSKKQDIVMIPLTKEFFPSPNCPLFVQFHKARCSAAVNYYFRRPGNPGDLSRIPNYADAFREEGEEKGGGEKELDGKAPPSPTSPEVGHDLTSSEETEKGAEQATADEDQFIDTAGDWEAAKVGEDSYPSREALYRGVIESIEETLFDTDQEMREAYARERARGCETYGTYSAKQRRVLPVMCAVAFRHEISKTATPGESSPSMSTPAHPAFGAGIVMGNCTVNIVGCFGFVSVQDEVEAAHQEGLSTHLGTPLGSSVPIPPPQPGSCVSSELSNYAPATPLQSIMQVGGQSLLSYPGGMAADGGAKGLLMTLPASAAAPLAAMVFLTKSAGEQKLSHVTFVAASTYYFQMIQAGVISRRPNFPLSGAAAFGTYYGGMSPPTGDGPPPLPYPLPPSPFPPALGGSPITDLTPPAYLPPMATFSFSSLITNIPVLSFLYEMKCRWGYLGVLKTGTPTATAVPRPAALRWGMGTHSSGGLSIVGPGGGQDVTDEMEMWITPDQMLHGRISSDLAARLCWSLVERPEVIQERVLQLPSEETGYWRYRGLVDRAHPPPLPSPLAPIDPKDVYVMGSDVLMGFDEGDILRFDPARQLWYADHSIPLEGVVLAAMRPHCKRARESDPQDPGWVTRLVPVEEESRAGGGKSRGAGGITFPVPPPTPEQAEVMEANPGRYKVVHESRGNFYVYRFKRDGTTYYHGTVPDFANPNKKQLLSVASIDALPVNSTSEPSPLAPASTPVNLEKNPGRKISHPPGITTEQTVASSHKMNAPSSNNGPTRKSILNALFLDPHSAEEDPMVDPALAASPNASTPITGNDGKGGSFTRTASRQDYLANRVTSAAIEAARILMRNLYNYAYNLSTSTAPLANAEGGVGSPVSPCGSKLPTGGGSLAAANHSNSKAGPESPVHPIRVISRSYGSFSELSEANKAASPEGVGSFSSIQLTQAPKRYTEKGCYVWDWRRVKSDTVEDAK